MIIANAYVAPTLCKALSALHLLMAPRLSIEVGNIIVPILLMRKLRHREFKYFVN